MNRRQWLAAVRTAVFPVGMRPVKATILALPVDQDGQLQAWRNEIAAVTGLPVGTLQRHLILACQAGWLVHEGRGGRGRQGRYRVSTPTEQRSEYEPPLTELRPINEPPLPTDSESITDHHDPNSGSSTTSLLTPNSGSRGEPYKKLSERSEHVAVDQDREPQDHHDDNRGERNDELAELRIDKQPPDCVHCQRAVVWPSSPCPFHSKAS